MLFKKSDIIQILADKIAIFQDNFPFEENSSKIAQVT